MVRYGFIWFGSVFGMAKFGSVSVRCVRTNRPTVRFGSVRYATSAVLLSNLDGSVWYANAN